MGKYSPNIIANSMISCRTHNPDGEVVIYGNRRITWDKMVSRGFRIAQALIKLGVKKDDKVAFMFHNTPEFVEINIGIQIAGAIPTPMNYRYVTSEVQFQGSHSDAKVLIYDNIWAESVEPAIVDLPDVAHVICKGESGISNTIDYEAFVATGEDKDPVIATDFNDVAVMIYTGGTTGFPKGVMLSYGAHVEMFSTMMANLMVRVLTMEASKDFHKRMINTLPIPAKRILGPLLRTKLARKYLATASAFKIVKEKTYKQFTDPDAAKGAYKKARKAMYPSMPFFHDAAYANLFMGMLSGALIYVLPDTVGFDPEKILELVARERVVNLSNVPTGWKKLVSYPDFDRYDVRSVFAGTTGGGACSAALKKQIMEKFPKIMIVDVFGQTEMTPATSFKLDIDPDNITDRSVGKSIVKTKIVDENGKDVPRGEIGEILYKSSTVMKGYYKDEEKTEDVFVDGWFRSGDLGFFDENGEIRTVDRKKECINTGGEKVYPLEVEEIIQTHPKVYFAAVIGVPDEEWGSRIKAVIQLKNGESMTASEIIDFCRGKIAAYKIPRSIVFTPELPFSPAGKLLRQKVRDAHADA